MQLIIDALNLLLHSSTHFHTPNVYMIAHTLTRCDNKKSTIGCTTKENNKFAERSEERKPKKIKLQSRKGRTASLKTNNTQSL
jgi:hypothetical protein